MSFRNEFSLPSSTPNRSVASQRQQFIRSLTRSIFGISTILLFALATGNSLGASDAAAPFEPRQKDLYHSSTLLPFHAGWRVLEGTEAPPVGWAQPEFDDASWKQGEAFVGNFENQAPLAGLKLGAQAIGTDLGLDRRTRYFRTNFTYTPEGTGSRRLILDYCVKDGGVFYLNGVEIGRTPTMPRGEIFHETGAIATTGLGIKTGFFIDPRLLRAGNNVVAMSLHSYENEENSSDRIAMMELTLVTGWEKRPLTTVPTHVRVLWAETPQHQAVVSWTTAQEGKNHRIYYDIEPRLGKTENYAQTAVPVKNGPFSVSKSDVEYGVRPGHFHHVHLTGLKPDTRYYFVVKSDDHTSREFYFVTAPAKDRPLKILFGGDSRINGSEPYFHHDRRNMNRRMAALLEKDPEIIAFVHGGDYAQRAQWRYLAPWLADNELTTTQDGRILPIIAVRGNHDHDIGFEEVFWWPGQEGRYYYETRLNPAISLVTLNTEISLGGKQRQWLARTLEERRPATRWLIMQYHRPAYPSVRGISDAANRQKFWVPLFDQYRVDLAFESHDHALKRTAPILNNAINPDGVVYIGDGGLGVPVRNPDSTRWYFQEGGMAKATFHVHVISFGNEVLEGVAYGMGGEVVDQFERRARPAPLAIGSRAAAPLAEATPVTRH